MLEENINDFIKNGNNNNECNKSLNPLEDLMEMINIQNERIDKMERQIRITYNKLKDIENDKDFVNFINIKRVGFLISIMSIITGIIIININ